MRRIALIGAVGLMAVGAATIAVAQVNGDGEGTGPPAHVSECVDEPKQGGEFGACVSERASAFGRCVADAARNGDRPPVDECADLRPGNGAHNGGEDTNETNGASGEGAQPNGAGASVAAQTNPTEGLTRPPEQHGRDFGRQVTESARGNGPSADRNPTTGVTRPPEQHGRDFGGQVAENARGNVGGPPDG